jgi:hypothetical protein
LEKWLKATPGFWKAVKKPAAAATSNFGVKWWKERRRIGAGAKSQRLHADDEEEWVKRGRRAAKQKTGHGWPT